MIFYHRTTIGEAREIMRRGFRDQKWGFDVEGLASDRRLKVAGVWLTDHVPEEEDAPPGDASRGCWRTENCGWCPPTCSTRLPRPAS
ncbi:MAG: hypothetical protein HYW06_09105 [Gemmatimonadetes bacterium]|nr:hypothetical protein [Gemmatimonadota bacterium]